MIKNFKKLDIFCEELDDGLVIYGNTIENSCSKKYVQIKSYNDHRIAMSFTVLASIYFKFQHKYQIIIDDKNCVKKTYPSFFQDMHKYLGLEMEYA